MSGFTIRPFKPADLEPVKAITLEGFEGGSGDHGIEATFERSPGTTGAGARLGTSM